MKDLFQRLGVLAVFVAFGAPSLLPGTATADPVKESPTSNAMGCASFAYAQPFPTAPHGYSPRYNTIAHRFLREEELVRPVSSTEFEIVDDILDEAKATLRPLPSTATAAGYDDFALSSLRRIDCILIRHGFVYPVHGLVELLSDGLDPTMLNDDYLDDLTNGFEHNERRVSFIKQRGNGPFYVVDCDTASYLYLAIGEIMHYPLAMGLSTGHNFIYWLRPSNEPPIQFETMDGSSPADAVAARGDQIVALTSTQLEAYHDFTIAVAMMWKKEDHKAIAELTKGYHIDDSEPSTLGELAWLYTVDVPYTNPSTAISFARRAFAVQPDEDNIDDLACALELSGDNEAAVEQEKSLLTPTPSDSFYYSSNPSQISRDQQAIKLKQNCVDPCLHVDPDPFRQGVPPVPPECKS